MSSKKEKFQDKEYRSSYAESFLDTTIATQIRVLREQRGWTQGELAEYAGMKQSRISALENASYSAWGISTLKRLARAFDVPLSVTFGTFGRLVADVNQFNRRALERPAFDNDPAFAAATVHAQDGGTTPTEANQIQSSGASRLLIFRARTRPHLSVPLAQTTETELFTASVTARYGS